VAATLASSAFSLCQFGDPFHNPSMRLASNLALALLGCSTQPVGVEPPATRATAVPEPAASAAGAPTAIAAVAQVPEGEPCGELGCRLFDTPEQAFAAVLAKAPRVLGIGEAHAQKGTEGVASATDRFTRLLLPLLRDKAGDVVIELMMGAECGGAEKQVASAQKPVTEPQSTGNKNEFVTLGNEAKKLGIQPHPLRPSCDQLKAAADAGPDTVAKLLGLIAELSVDLVAKILSRNQREGRDRMVVVYGGALHNDASPAPGREDWSYATKVKTMAPGYVELDLIVPEYIKDTPAWTGLPWYPHYRAAEHGEHVVLFEPAAGSYVIVFPSSSK
jgi:hypothetical protein